MNLILSEVTPTRSFNLLYIILDSIFILILLVLLLYQKKYITLLFSLFGGILYFIVDYFGFYFLSSSRSVLVNGNKSELNTFLVLLWMSLSYGITNFCFIWLSLKKDKNLKEYLFLIISWWIVCPLISKLGGENNITTFRTVTSYRAYMGIVLFIGYFLIIIYNLYKKESLINILKLNLIGISVQFSWEISLLLGGIRPYNENSLLTLISDSLIETNLGMPYIYFIFIFIYKFFNEDLSKKKEN